MRNNDNRRRGLSRRRYAQLLAGIGGSALAGCPSDSGRDTDAPTARPTDDESGAEETTSGGGTADGSETETSANTPEGDPVTDTLRVFASNTPDVFDANPWTPADNTTGIVYMTDLQSVRNVHTRGSAYSGLTVETPWKATTDEVSVMTWFSDVEVDPPYDIYETHDDRATYWNGDPLDAEARELHNRVDWFQLGNKFAEGERFQEEAAGQWEYHRWYADGSGELADNPQATHILEAEAGPNEADVPLHPAFLEPYRERYEEASSTDAVTGVTEDLASDRITLQRLSENGWGSGPYEIRSMDDVGSERMVLRLRDGAAADAGETELAHPNAENTNVPNLAVYWGEGDRRQTLATNGELDLNGNIVGESTLFSRETLPDHMQELTRWLRSTGGDKWRFNWHNEHLGRLWVRRALVTAVDWHAAGANGWGAQRSVPVEHDTYLLDAQSEVTFSGEFLDSLHTWPKESDYETATEYMQRAGYTRQGGNWVDPNGNPAEIDLIYPSAIADYGGAAQTIEANLSEFGFGVNFSNQGWGSWASNLNAEGGLNYDSSIFWHGYPNVFGYYWTNGAWTSGTLLMGDPTTSDITAPIDPGVTDERPDAVDTQGKPLRAELPSTVGSIEAPDEAGTAPSLDDGEAVDLPSVVHEIRQPGNSDEELRELYRTCARYYNYYLPHFTFHQYTWGAWGNLRDFEWPDPNHRALDFERGFGISDVLIHGGLVEASYDTDFPSPES